ncbi:MAG: hypothetical protein HN348_24020 [Proteobacteria bacterium]|jgi:hypothetical protein|nr:hypothetical protein [Pseudomonadota bacterium]
MGQVLEHEKTNTTGERHQAEDQQPRVGAVGRIGIYRIDDPEIDKEKTEHGQADNCRYNPCNRGVFSRHPVMENQRLEGVQLHPPAHLPNKGFLFTHRLSDKSAYTTGDPWDYVSRCCPQ